MILTLDHVTIAGSNLDTMRRAFAAAGLPTNYGGRHANGITHMALAGFDDGSYLELIAPIKPFDHGSGMMAGWGKFMAADAGACAWAIRTDNLHREVEHLRSAGVPVSIPELGGRRTVDGKELQWQTATAGPGPAGAVLPFMIQDKTPREWRVQPSATMRDAALTGIAHIIIAVHDLNASITLFRRAYGWPEPTTEARHEFGSDANAAHFVATPVVLVSPREPGSPLSRRLARFGDCPVAYLLQTRDFHASCKRLRLVPSSTPWIGRRIAWFDPSRICGTWIGVAE
jgi:hypothetical protein